MNATILSLSVSEAEGRILSFTWGVVCPLHISMSLVLLLHCCTATLMEGIITLPLYWVLLLHCLHMFILLHSPCVTLSQCHMLYTYPWFHSITYLITCFAGMYTVLLNKVAPLLTDHSLTCSLLFTHNSLRLSPFMPSPQSCH